VLAVLNLRIVLLTVVDYCLLECDAVFSLADAYQKFRRSMLPLS
jgi:hypothetical protein